MISAFGTSDWGGYSAQVGNIMSTAGQWDNMIAYQTPDFAGFKVYAQYGMGTNDHENESSSDRYYALGATYNNGPLAGYFAIDSINYESVVNKDVDDSLTVTLGGSYDFEVVKVYLGGQYFDEVKASSLNGVTEDFAEWNDNTDKVKGYALTLSADAPVAGGKAMFGVGYFDAEQADSVEDNLGEKYDFSRFVVSIGYDYPFSKRTDIYAVASYMQDSIEDKTDAKEFDSDPSAYAVYVGLRHRF